MSRKKISILYFNNVTHESGWDWLSKGLTDMLIDDLSQIDVLVCSSLQEIEDLYQKYAGENIIVLQPKEKYVSENSSKIM